MNLAHWFGGRDDGSGDDVSRPVPRDTAWADVPVATTNPVDDDERALAARVRLGDESAIAWIIDRYGDRLLRLAFSIVRAEDTAKDIVQDALVSIWLGRDRIDTARGISGYLIRAVRNRALDVKKHDRAQARLRASMTPPARAVSPPDDTDETAAHELAATVRNTLEHLQPRVREIFLMHREAGMSYADIAAALGVSSATVHSQMSRAVRAIARAIQGPAQGK